MKGLETGYYIYVLSKIDMDEEKYLKDKNGNYFKCKIPNCNKNSVFYNKDQDLYLCIEHLKDYKIVLKNIKDMKDYYKSIEFLAEDLSICSSLN